ncbi:hypothetical protein MCEMIH16_03155 [Caulobacteraceae bacterium]
MARNFWADAPAYDGSYEITDEGGERAIRVLLKANRISFFANMLPPGGWNFSGDATAVSVSMVPLCVLITQAKGALTLDVCDFGRITAPDCIVYSNRDIRVAGGSIAVAAVQAVTSATGSMTPSPGTGAAVVADPFSTLKMDSMSRSVCSDTSSKIEIETGALSLPPGYHCSPIHVSGSARITLQPGEHWFVAGQLEISGSARLEGGDVALFFDKTAQFEFSGKAVVRLSGRKSGPYAGLVIGATRGNNGDFTISSDNVESLLGVIYVPSGRLTITGSADVARESAWTVIVADRLLLQGSPKLYINANYGASDVPVPTGVGPTAGGVRLAH